MLMLFTALIRVTLFSPFYINVYMLKSYKRGRVGRERKGEFGNREGWGRKMKGEGKKRKETLVVALIDNKLEEGKIRMNKTIRKNLRVRLGDIVQIRPAGDQ